MRQHKLTTGTHVEHHLWGSQRDIESTIATLLTDYPSPQWATWVALRTLRPDGQYARVVRLREPLRLQL